MGCTPSKTEHLPMAERRLATGIGQTGRLPQRMVLPGIEDDLKAAQDQNPDLKSLGRKSVASKSITIKPGDAAKLPKLNMAGQLVPEEVQKRISGSTLSTKITVAGRNITYAALTQRGFYPDNMLKPNQDAFAVKNNIGGEGGVYHFAVYDGHGDEGHKCAAYAKKKLPIELDKESRKVRVKAAKSEAVANGTKFKFNPKIWPALTKDQCENIFERAYESTNKDMHEDTTVPDNLSGTTAISAMLCGNFFTVSNTGDSRGVLGTLAKGDTENIDPTQKDDNKQPKMGNLVATPFSHDQTPYRKDELIRVRKAGARVLTIDQVNNDEPEQEYWEEKEVNYDGDVPRIWKQTKKFPGTAFTRSLGDSIAEDLGVIATPEMISKELTSDDKVLVLGSDGIFEFLSNQVVLDICRKHEDPLDACRELLEASYNEWLEYETRVDDITCLVIYLE